MGLLPTGGWIRSAVLREFLQGHHCGWYLSVPLPVFIIAPPVITLADPNIFFFLPSDGMGVYLGEDLKVHNIKPDLSFLYQFLVFYMVLYFYSPSLFFQWLKP